MSSRILAGHAPAVLAGLEAESCHLVVTSPPYLWLRSYGTPPQVWPNPDGTPLCADGAHEWRSLGEWRKGGQGQNSTLDNGTAYREARDTAAQVIKSGAFCARCNAWRGELGSEPTVERYIADLVFVFDAVRRVLRRDGLCWVNLSGSYFNNPGGQNGGGYSDKSTLGGYTSENTKGRQLARISARAVEANRQAGRQDRIGAARSAGTASWLKPLDWVDTPGLFAHAMQRAGWWWRADIALVKKSPLPESVQGTRWERCRVKLAKNKHCDPQGRGGQQRMMENPEDNRGVNPDWLAQWADCPGCDKCRPNDGLILRRGNGRPTRAWERFLVFAKAPGAYFDNEAVREPPTGRTDAMRFWKKGHEEAARSQGLRQDGERVFTLTADVGRNLRDWQFWPTSAGLKEAHFASYPIALAELAIRASTPERGVCPKCAAPWARIVTVSGGTIGRAWHDHEADDVRGHRGGASAAGMADYRRETSGWRPTCSCNAGAPVPAVVLDPFCGSGSTLLAADRLGRDAIGIDVQPQYIELAARRARRDAPLFADVSVEGQAAAAARWDATHAPESDMVADGATPKGRGREALGLRTPERMGHGPGWRQREAGAQLSAEVAAPHRDLFSVLDELQEGARDAAG